MQLILSYIIHNESKGGSFLDGDILKAAHHLGQQ